jgi:hypothetical protein
MILVYAAMVLILSCVPSNRTIKDSRSNKGAEEAATPTPSADMESDEDAIVAATPTPTPDKDSSSLLATFASLFSSLKADPTLITAIISSVSSKEPSLAIAALQAYLAGANQEQLKAELKKLLDDPKALDEFVAKLPTGTGRLKELSQSLMNKLNVTEANQKKVFDNAWFQKIDTLLQEGRVSEAKEQLLLLLNSAIP